MKIPDGKKKGRDPSPNPKKTTYIINDAIQEYGIHEASF